MEKRSLPLSNALEICEKSLQEYKEKTIENTKKEELGVIVPIKVSEENTLFYDAKSKRYFMCDSKTIEKAENKINEKLKSQNVYLNDFYDEINLERAYPGALLGWLKGSKIHINEVIITEYGTNKEIHTINFDEDISLDEMEEKWPYLSDEERMHIFKKYIGLEV